MQDEDLSIIARFIPVTLVHLDLSRTTFIAIPALISVKYRERDYLRANYLKQSAQTQVAFAVRESAARVFAAVVVPLVHHQYFLIRLHVAHAAPTGDC